MFDANIIDGVLRDPRRRVAGAGPGQAGRRQHRLRRDIPTSGFKDSFDVGWNGTIGATFNINEHLGVQGEYIYARMHGPEKTIFVSPVPGGASSDQLIESNHQMHIGAINLVYKNHRADRMVGGYVLGGLGIYHRIIQLTSPAIGYTTFCDPYWYVCYPAAVSVDNILGDRSSNDFGVDFGGGVTFGHEAKFYVETRYHYVWGPTITSTASTLRRRQRRPARVAAARTPRTSR